jgi:hypothetical protein
MMGEDLHNLSFLDRKAALARLLRDIHFAMPAGTAIVSRL